MKRSVYERAWLTKINVISSNAYADMVKTILNIRSIAVTVFSVYIIFSLFFVQYNYMSIFIYCIKSINKYFTCIGKTFFWPIPQCFIYHWFSFCYSFLPLVKWPFCICICAFYTIHHSSLLGWKIQHEDKSWMKRMKKKTYENVK